VSDGTKIEWTDATWNPITGCSVVSPGCTNCYAMKLAGGRLKHTVSRVGLTIDTKAGAVWNGEVRLNQHWLTQPIAWGRPRRVFVCAHGDLFHESVPDAWIDRIFAVMAMAPRHTFQVLTKRAARMAEYVVAAAGRVADNVERFDRYNPGKVIPGQYAYARSMQWPLPHVWLGVSVEDQKRADERIPLLLRTPAAVRWLSCEPLLGAVRLDNGDTSWLSCDGRADDGHCCTTHDETGARHFHGIDWVVAGGEFGHGARPMHPGWARSLRDQCVAAGVPFFFKQWGAWAPGYVEHGNELPYELLATARQHEWPQGHASYAVGKKAAGRQLDGRAWDEYPRAAA
jgi:protein gp37